MNAASLAQWSNTAVYASMVFLTFSMMAYAVMFSARGTRGLAKTTIAHRVPVSVGAAGNSVPPVADIDESLDVSGRRAGNIATSLAWFALGLLIIGTVLRGVWAGRVPWGNMYEYSLSSGVAVLGLYLLWSLRRDIRWLGLFVTAATLLTLGLAVTVLYTEAAQLVPALESWWLVIHVAAAIICGGAFTVAAGITGLYLWRERAERKSRVRGVVARLPQAATLDTMAYRILAFAFPLWTFAVIAGAIWAENAWGRYWGWDPKETWAFITWVIYAGYLHARATAGWKGRRAAYIALIGWLSYLINYFGVNLFINSLHSYAGV